MIVKVVGFCVILVELVGVYVEFEFVIDLVFFEIEWF